MLFGPGVFSLICVAHGLIQRQLLGFIVWRIAPVFCNENRRNCSPEAKRTPGASRLPACPVRGYLAGLTFDDDEVRTALAAHQQQDRIVAGGLDRLAEPSEIRYFLAVDLLDHVAAL